MEEISEKIDNKSLMTIRDIAEVIGVSYDTINRCVKRIFPDKLQHGKTAYFDENEIACISKELKSNTSVLSHQTVEVSATVKGTTTELEVIANYKAATEALISMLNEKNKALKAENEAQKQQLTIQQPKVDFYNAVTDSGDCMDIGQVAKLLNCGYGRNTLFEILRKKGVLDKRNQPYQRFVDAGYFRVIESSYVLPNGDQKINLKTVVYQKGVDFIRKIVAE